ncbi:hypothetical protein J6590_008555 [Homalodisca vitripennis]|nr:hypothetical protein J6590_008555 [Homalodisca vitripennis]
MLVSLMALLLSVWGGLCLCYGFVLLSSTAAAGGPRLFEPPSACLYSYHATLLLNEAAPGRGKDVGFQVTASLSVETVWQSASSPLNKLLKLKGSILGPVLFLVYISRRNSSLLRGKKLNSCIQYDVRIEETDSTKFLGMYLNRSFFRHLCSTEPFEILLLGCTKNGLVHPHIMYESRLWGSCSKYKFERVFRSQKKAVRIISKFKSQNSCRDAFRELGFLTLSCLYILDVALYCRFKCEFVQGKDVYQYGTRGRDNLRLHPHRTAAFKRLPSEVGVKLINKLPDEIRNLN